MSSAATRRAKYVWAMSAGEVVIVSGPPGSGKTTVAGALAAEATLGVHLESDWFYRFVKGGFVAPHLPESHRQNVLVMDICINAAASYAAGGYTVFWDGIVGPWFFEQICSGLGDRGLTPRYLALRPPRDVALKRVRERDGTTETSVAEKMYDEFADLGPFEKHVLSSDAEPNELLEACRAALTESRFILSSPSETT